MLLRNLLFVLLVTCSAVTAQLPFFTYDGNGGPLTANNVYTVTGPGITVPAGETLTVEVGAIVKFFSGSLIVQGTLNVVDNGAPAGARAIFTSIHDDEGGNTNQSPQLPAPGDWIALQFTTGTGTLDRLEVRYAGAGGGAAVIANTSPTLVDCSVRDCLGAGLSLSSQGTGTFTNCEFVNCLQPVTGVPFPSLSGFSGCAASGCAATDSMMVTNDQWSGPVTVTTDNLLLDNVLRVTTPTIHANASLTLEEGVVVKFSPNGLLGVAGELYTLGTAANPVAFTSGRDDDPAYGGNSNGNQSPPAAAPGDWTYFTIQNGAQAEFHHTHFRYGGSTGNGGMIDLRGRTTMDHCVVEKSSGAALYAKFLTVPDDVHITNCAFVDNATVACLETKWRMLMNCRDNTATGNGGDYFDVWEFTVPGSVEIYPWNYPGTALVTSWAINVPVASSLTLHQGVILKQKGSLANDIAGTLNLNGTGYRPVVVTSFEDDTHGGDTNNGPPAVGPDPVPWYGFPTQPSSTIRMHHAILAWAGTNTRPAVDLRSSGYDVYGTRAENCLGIGFQLRALGTLTHCVAYNCLYGFEISSGSSGQELVHCTASRCTRDGLQVSNGSTCTVRNSIFYGNLLADLNGTFSPGDVTYSCTGNATPLGVGNTQADPMFVDQAAGDLRLQTGSPCINAGNAALPAPIPIVDIAENSRRNDPELVGNDAPDMGAHERARWSFDVDGWLRPGEGITLRARGPSGLYVAVLGSDTFAEAFPPWGYLTISPLWPGLPLGPYSIGPAGDVFFAWPAGLPGGIPIHLQAVCFGDAGSGGGAGMTNRCRQWTFAQ